MKNYKYTAVIERNGVQGLLEAQCNDEPNTNCAWYDELEWSESHNYFDFANNEEREKVYGYLKKAFQESDYQAHIERGIEVDCIEIRVDESSIKGANYYKAYFKQPEMECTEPKTFTTPEVEQLIRDTMLSSINGFRDWLKNETDIVDKTTREVLLNTEIELKPNAKLILANYVYPKLRENGIYFGDLSDANS